MSERSESPQSGTPESPGSGEDAVGEAPQGATQRTPTGAEHWLCSELVELRWMEAAGTECYLVANLEEIWREGAIVDAEAPVPEGVSLRIRCSGAPDAAPASNSRPVAFPARHELQATVEYCRESDTGYAVGISFASGSDWNPDVLLPQHAVNPRELEQRAVEAAEAAPKERAAGDSGGADSDSRRRAADQAVEQGSLFQLAVHAAKA